MAGKGSIIGLGLVCVILVAALGWTYMGTQSKDSQIQSLTTQITIQQSWLTSNMTRVNNLTSQINQLNTQIDALNSNISALETLKLPKLMAINLLSTDTRSIPDSPYLHIVGVVCNVGANPAKNCRLHVQAVRGGTQVLDTYVTLGTGTIAGEYYVNVDTNVWYSGAALDSWAVNPVWTSN